jgi:sugar phosphate isomerase/epimerase
MGAAHCSYEMFMEDVRAMEKAASAANSEGLELWYHNHNTEFSILFDGYRAIDLMLAQAENIHLMLDVGWCALGGADPVNFIKRWPDRVRMYHIKDYQEAPLRPAWGAKYHSAFTTPGTGVVDIEGVLKIGCELGLEWASVEMDSMNRLSPMLSLQTAYCNMKEYGYVE